MRQEIVQTKESDTERAAESLCSKLKKPLSSYSIVIFFASSRYDFKKLSDSTASLSNALNQKMTDLQSRIKDVVSENDANGGFMDALQKTAMDSNEKLVKINTDSERNVNFTEMMVKRIEDNQNKIIKATKESEKQNIEQVRDIASKAAVNSIQLGDQLSFIFELDALFDYIEKNGMLRASE